MDKLNKTFVDGDTLSASDLNPMSQKVDEIVQHINDNPADSNPIASITSDSDKLIVKGKDGNPLFYVEPASDTQAGVMSASDKQKLDGMELRVQSAESSASNAEESAEQAQQKLSELEDAIQNLPDGQAVSAQVAKNTTKLSDLEQKINNSIGETKPDFSVADENGIEIVQFKDGHIKTKNFDSSKNIMLDSEKKKLSEIEDGAEVNDTDVTDSSYDFSISDEQGNDIMQVKDGHIKTKNFDSSVPLLVDEMSVPDYYKSHIEEKANYIANIIELQNDGNAEEFIFTTDTHVRYNMMNSPMLINYLIKHTNVNKVFWGGDAIYAYSEKSTDTPTDCKRQIIEEWRKQSDGYTKSVRGTEAHYYPIRGNHDLTMRISGTDTSVKANNGYTFSHGVVKNEIIGRTNNHFDSYADDFGCYYYFDNKSSKTRFIVLDGQSKPIDSTIGDYAWGNDGGLGISNSQVEWITNKAFVMPDDYNIIIAIHEGLVSDTYYGGYTFYNNIIGLIENIAITHNVIVVNGHYHQDNQSYKNGVLHIGVCNDYVGNDYKRSPFMSDAPTRIEGSITEQAFDFINVDWNNGIVRCVRIGAGYDRTFHLNPIDVNVGSSVQLLPTINAEKYDLYDCNLSSFSGSNWSLSKTRGSITQSGLYSASNVGEVLVAAFDENNNKEFFYIKNV